MEVRMPHKSFPTVLLLLGTVAVAGQTLPVPGVGPAAGGTSSYDYPLLLAMPAVQKDTGLTPEQFNAARDLRKDLTRRESEAKRALDKKLKGKERLIKLTEIREKFDKEYHDGLAKLLKPAQLTRLGQIRLQTDAPGSFAWPAVTAKLKPTAEQKKQLEKIVRDLNADRLNITVKESPEANTDPAKQRALQEKLRGLTKKAVEHSLKVFDSEQQKAWAELTGPVFDVSKLGFAKE
jgi:hypothetical protein